VTTIAQLPALAADEKVALGQPVYAGPKRGWLVPKFGFGTAGAIYRVTADGKVTLRGPVKTDAEKSGIVTIAKSVAGEGNVDDQLEVKANP